MKSAEQISSISFILYSRYASGERKMIRSRRKRRWKRPFVFRHEGKRETRAWKRDDDNSRSNLAIRVDHPAAVAVERVREWNAVGARPCRGRQPNDYTDLLVHISGFVVDQLIYQSKRFFYTISVRSASLCFFVPMARTEDFHSHVASAISLIFTTWRN